MWTEFVHAVMSMLQGLAGHQDGHRPEKAVVCRHIYAGPGHGKGAAGGTGPVRGSTAPRPESAASESRGKGGPGAGNVAGGLHSKILVTKVGIIIDFKTPGVPLSFGNVRHRH